MGADFSKHPIGTGAYALKEFAVGEKCVLVKRPAPDYWGPEAYLDTITYIDHGDDASAHLAALASKQVDMVHEIGIDSSLASNGCHMWSYRKSSRHRPRWRACR